MVTRMLGKIVTMMVVLTLLWSCSQDDFNSKPDPVINPINEFVWGGMNSWYYWQGEVNDLSDSRFKSLAERNDYLNRFSTPESLFDYLQHPDDEFSWMVDDYIALENSFQGITYSHGFEYSLIRISGTDNIIGYVVYVIPGTNAESQGVERGQIFYGINGSTMDINNYVNLLTQNTITLNLAEYVDGELTNTDQTIAVTAQEVSENPVHLTKILDVDGVKVGYLVYNQFIHTRHSELNAAFGQLRNEGATELVLDLRYNPGGSVFTSLILAGMIHNAGTENDTFSKLIYNEKKTEQNYDFPFLTEVPLLDAEFNLVSNTPETMNRLNLDRVFILTTRGTASASELIINGLKPYMEVIQIGDTTRGKNEGSVTLYDSPGSDYRNKETANPDHLYAMQPIVSKIANAVGFGDYSDGLLPQIAYEEFRHLDQMRPLGDPEEPFLKLALDIISGAGSIGRTDRESKLEGKWMGMSPARESLPPNPLLDGLDFPLYYR